VTLKTREGPAGWRSVVAVPGGGEIALWQSKGWRPGGEDPFARETTKKIRHTIGEP
jgi:hypothetical protein